jgi:hypothetical protein
MNVSLIVRVFNPNRDWLQQALASIPEGLFYELIIVDDGSYPSVPEATLHGKDEGQGMARNHGIERSTGEWIATLDYDDYFEKSGILHLFDYCGKHPEADIIHFPLKTFGSETSIRGLNPNPTLEDFLDQNQIVSGSWHKRSVWEKLNGFRINECEDWDFWLRAKAEGFKFLFFPEIVYLHRVHEVSRWESYGKYHIEDTKREILFNYYKTYVDKKRKRPNQQKSYLNIREAIRKRVLFSTKKSFFKHPKQG